MQFLSPFLLPGLVIAGTIGGGPHLEFGLIGDTTNVAARVEHHRIEGAGHYPAEQRPDLVNPLLIDFLDRHRDRVSASLSSDVP